MSKGRTLVINEASLITNQIKTAFLNRFMKGNTPKPSLVTNEIKSDFNKTKEDFLLN